LGKLWFFFTSFTNPMSSIWSASSSTKACKWSKSIKPCLCKSSNLPGLQLKYQHRFSGRQLVGFVKHHQNGKLGKVSYFPYVSKLCPICTASSLVRVTTNARICLAFFDDDTVQLMYNRYGKCCCFSSSGLCTTN
jgi:hypothetical protein